MEFQDLKVGGSAAYIQGNMLRRGLDHHDSHDLEHYKSCLDVGARNAISIPRRYDSHRRDTIVSSQACRGIFRL